MRRATSRVIKSPPGVTSNPLNYRPPNSARHYVPPKRVDVRRFAMGLTLAAGIAAMGGFAYGWIQADLDNLYVRVGAVGVAAGAVALLSLIPARYGRVRRPVVAAFAGAIIGLVALYAMWLAWVCQELKRMQFSQPLGLLVRHPLRMLRLIQDLASVGTWSYRGEITRGPSLVALWIGEAAAVLCAGVLPPLKQLYNDDPVCSDCGARCARASGLPRFADDRADDLVAAMENGEYESLLSHAAPTHEDSPELSLSIFSCSHCGTTNVLTVSSIAWYDDAQGRATVKTTPVIDQLLITAEDAVQLKDVCARVAEQRKPMELDTQGEAHNV